MHCRLHRLGLVTATLLLSLTSPIQVALPLPNSGALAQAQTNQDRKTEAVRLNKTGLEQLNSSQFREALQTFEQALGIFREIGDRQSERTTLNNIGLVYRNLGQYADALKSYEQALVIAKQIGDNAGEGTALINIGGVYHRQGQYADALKFYEQGLIIAKEVGNRAQEGITLNNIGGVYDDRGEYADALKFYKQALVIHQQLENKVMEGTTLNNIGVIYHRRGEYADALKSFEQALVIHQQVRNKAVEATTLNNIGQVYTTIGQYTQALKFHEQALVIAKQIRDKAGEGVILNNIGDVYHRQGQYANALKSYEQALVAFKEIGSKAGEGTILNNIGELYNDLGQYAQALKFHEQALVIHQQVGNKAGEGTTLHNIGGLYHILGQYAQALKFYEQALAIAKQIGDKAGEGDTLNNIGEAYNRLKQYPDAEKTLFAAIEVRESLRPGLTDASKISIFETQAHSYRFLQQALVAQNKTNTALEVAERGRARAFVELLAEKFSANVGVQGVAPQKLPINPPKIQQIQQIAREQNATLVEYSIVYDAFKNQGKVEWRQSELYIWAVKPTGEVAFKQVDLKSLNTPLTDLVTNSREALGVRGRSIFEVTKPPAPDQTQRLQQLNKLLIEPIAQFLPTNPSDRVIFIPQNQLFLVPFPALKDASGKYLIEKHTILTAPAIQVLQLTREKRQSMGNREWGVGSGDVLVVGNPTMPTNLTTPTGELIKLSPLPNAEQEALAIANLLKTKALTGDRATKAVVEQQMTKARIIHLATHGLLDDFKGKNVPGAIALAPSGTGELNDGLLTSNEIFDMKLNAELVVLSACDTGRGDITGDGVIGLSRSLISAGVPSVIVSLWSVPDASTASLMTEFYRQLQQNPDKATALRQAMLTTMKQHPNPKHWAAFTLIGEAK